MQDSRDTACRVLVTIGVWGIYVLEEICKRCGLRCAGDSHSP